MPDPDALAGALRALPLAQPEHLDALLAGLGAPPLDLCTTPLATRAALLAAARGAAFCHHEARRRLPMPPELAPEVEVWGELGTTPVWQAGVLQEPKYFSFFQDAPLPAFNPNHRRKWRPHELLHMAQGFFWSPDMTRFAFTLGARLNELVPVVHWYGWDEAFRPACPAHLDLGARRLDCLACEAAARPWWDADPTWWQQRADAAAPRLRDAHDHLRHEWLACLRELDTGRPCPTPRVGLDASSDAIGYLRGHWNRVTAWSFGAWAERFLIDGEDYFSTLEPAFARAANVARDLTSGPLSASLPQARARRARRALQDMGYRLFLALEWLEAAAASSAAARRAAGAAQRALQLASPACAALLNDPLADPRDAFAALREAALTLDPLLPDPLQGALLATGYLWFDLEPLTGLRLEDQTQAATPSLIEGIQSAAPMSAQGAIELLHGDLHGFVSGVFQEAGPLASRWASWLEAAKSPAAALARYEAALARGPLEDEEAEDFATIPEDLGELSWAPGALRLHATLRRVWLPLEVAEELLEALPDEVEDEVELAIFFVRGESRVVVVDEGLRGFLEADGEPRAAWLSLLSTEALEALLDEGLLVWLPSPLSRGQGE